MRITAMGEFIHLKFQYLSLLILNTALRQISEAQRLHCDTRTTNKHLRRFLADDLGTRIDDHRHDDSPRGACEKEV